MKDKKKKSWQWTTPWSVQNDVYDFEREKSKRTQDGREGENTGVTIFSSDVGKKLKKFIDRVLNR